MTARWIVTTTLILFLSSPVLAQQGSVTVTGFLTDTRCGAKGANALHVDCARRNVASGKAKYALYDQRTKKLYVLDPQNTAVTYLGQRVQMTGTVSFGEQLNSDVLHILAVAPAPPPGSKSKP